MSGAVNAAKSVGKAVFGGGGNPGALGTGQRKVEKYKIDRDAYDAEGLRDLGDQAGQRADEVQNRQGPSMAAAQVGEQERMQTARIDPSAMATAATARAARLGDAQQIDQVNIDNNRQDQFRSGQQRLVSDLERQAAGEGPSLAESTMRKGIDEGLASQMALMASQRGDSNPALAARQAQQNQARASSEAAGQGADIRMQEQMAAREQLAGVQDSARAQDIGMAQAQANLAAQQNQFNAEQGNQFGLQQGQMQQQANMANAQMRQDVGLANTAAQNERAMQQAQLSQQARQMNAEQANQMTVRRAELEQEARQGNQQAALEMQQLDDQLEQFYAGQQMDAETGAMASAQALEQLSVDQNLGIEAARQASHGQAAQARQGLGGGLLNAAGGAIGMLSDEREKIKLKAVDSYRKGKK